MEEYTNIYEPEEGSREEQQNTIPHQRDLDPPCYCDITYVCDECKRKPRRKIMDAI